MPTSRVDREIGTFVTFGSKRAKLAHGLTCKDAKAANIYETPREAITFNSTRTGPQWDRWQATKGQVMIKFWVPAEAASVKQPVSQGDLTATRQGRLYYQNHKELDPWRYEITWRARKAMRQGHFHVTDGPVTVDVLFVMHRPKATPKRRATPEPIKKPDLDKLQRAVLDAMTSHVYLDDSQVVEIRARKTMAELGEPTGAQIQVSWIDDRIRRLIS